MRLIILVTPILFSSIFAFAQKATPPPELLVSGTIHFEPGAISGGDLYVTVSPEGAESIKVEKSDGKAKDKKRVEQLPESSVNQFLHLGRNNGKAANFSIKLTPGRYRLGCLVKLSEPPCSSYRINNGKTVTTCLPGKDDIICADLNIQVETTAMPDITLKAGLPVK